MLELNKVFLVGNLTQDPVVRSTSTGRSVASMRLAVNRRRGSNRETGESQEETLFIDVSAWERTAEFCGNYLSKGRRIFVEGRLQMDEWDDRESGQKRSKIQVVAERVQFADPKPTDGGGSGGGGGYGGGASGGGSSEANTGGGNRPPENTNDDLPF